MSRENRKSSPIGNAPGRYAYEGLQRVFHEKARLGIMTSLVANQAGVAFSDLKELCGLSDGNLNRHLKALKDEGFVQVEREGGGRSAKSTCQITKAGKLAFANYLSELQRVLDDANRG